MADWQSVTPGEHGVLRVFGIDLPDADIAAFATEAGTAWPLRDTLGVSSLDPKFVEVVDLETFRSYGFARYLAEGYGIAEADLYADTARLDALSGHVTLVVSQAFGGQAANLTVTPPLRHIATFRADTSGTPTGVLHAETAKPQAAPEGTPPKPPRTDASTGGRIALFALLAATVLVVLMIWIAG